MASSSAARLLRVSEAARPLCRSVPNNVRAIRKSFPARRDFSVTTSQRLQSTPPTSEGASESTSEPADKSSSKDALDILVNAMSKRNQLGSFGAKQVGSRSKLAQWQTENGDPSGSGLLDALQLENKAFKPRGLQLEHVPKPALRLGPSVGRTVEIDTRTGVDVGRGFALLNTLCNRNKVKRSFIDGKFHERPGLRRKRLKYASHIRTFNNKFTKVVQMVQRMTKSGW